MNVEKYGAGVFTVSKVLNATECDSLIAYSERLGFDGAVMGDLSPKEVKHLRTRTLIEDQKPPQMNGLFYNPLDVKNRSYSPMQSNTFYFNT